MNHVPPSSEEMERGLIGAVLMDSDHAMPIATEAGICAESFYLPIHRIIWSAICGMVERKRPVDMRTVIDRLNELSQLESVGGINTLTAIMDACPASAHAAFYADRVVEKQKARAMIDEARAMAEQLYRSEATVEEVASSHELALSRICKRREQKETIASAAAALLDRWETPIDARPIAPRFPWEWLHAACSDLVDELVYIAAQPSVGKTAAAVNLAVFNARRGVAVLFVSLESSLGNVSKRFISHMARVNCLTLRGISADAGTRQRARDSVEEMRTLPLTVIDQPMTEAQLCAAVKRHKAKGFADLVIVDNLKHVQPSRQYGSEPERFKAISEQVKWMRDEVRVPVVMLHHLTDEGKMAWSRDVQRDADIIIHMANATEPYGGHTRRVAWKIDKNRDGIGGIGKEMKFHTDVQTFEAGA